MVWVSLLSGMYLYIYMYIIYNYVNSAELKLNLQNLFNKKPEPKIFVYFYNLKIIKSLNHIRENVEKVQNSRKCL